jgi:hypothetical protein
MSLPTRRLRYALSVEDALDRFSLPKRCHEQVGLERHVKWLIGQSRLKVSFGLTYGAHKS